MAGKKRAATWAILGSLGGLALTALLVFGLLPLLRPPLSAPAPSPELLQSTRGLDEIAIQAVFVPETSRLEVTQRLTLTNRGPDARNAALLRAYPNAFASEETSPIATEEVYDRCYPGGFSPGFLSVSSLSLGMDGKPLAPASFHDQDKAQTLLNIALPTPWQPGATLTLEAVYTLQVPKAAYRFGENNGLWALGNAFLLPAPYEDGAYRTDPYSPIGDPFVSDCANFTVDLEAPSAYTVAGSAWPQVAQTAEGRNLWSFSAYGVRDFALCLSEEYQAAQAMEGNVLVTVYGKNKRQLGPTLRYASQALRCFSKRFGPYPYPAFTLAEVDFPFGGMEYPGLVMLGSAPMGQADEDFEWLVAHETAHQWWYGVVGSDQVNQAWQDEALAEYSLLDYVEDFHGRQARQDVEFRRIETAMRVTIPRGVTPGSPVSYFGDMGEYGLVVYRRGAAMLCALDRAMNGALDDFLKSYYDEYRFRRATREDFERRLKEFSGEDWSPLMVDYLDTYLAN